MSLLAQDHARPRADPAVLRALLTLASLVTTSTGEQHLVEAVAETARELLWADSLSISRLLPDGQTIATVINVGELGPGEARWPTDEHYVVSDFPETLAFLVGRQMRRWATHVDDPDAEPAEVALLRSLAKTSSVKTQIIVPGRLWGELWAARGSSKPHFDEQDVELAAVIVALVAAGLAQASAWEVVHAQATTDPLTGLANRRAFDEQLRACLGEALVRREAFSLAVGDLNGLKPVNDSKGHAAGDEALVHAARAAVAAIDGVPGAMAARMGGDEYALVLPGLDAAAAEAIASAWCDAARHPVHGTSLACGLAVVVAGGGLVDPHQLLSAADRAQYEAKTTASSTPVLVELNY